MKLVISVDADILSEHRTVYNTKKIQKIKNKITKNVRLCKATPKIKKTFKLLVNTNRKTNILRREILRRWKKMSVSQHEDDNSANYDTLQNVIDLYSYLIPHPSPFASVVTLLYFHSSQRKPSWLTERALPRWVIIFRKFQSWKEKGSTGGMKLARVGQQLTSFFSPSTRR